MPALLTAFFGDDGKSSANGGVVSLGEVFDANDFLSALGTVAVTRRAVTEPALRMKD